MSEPLPFLPFLSTEALRILIAKLDKLDRSSLTDDQRSRLGILRRELHRRLDTDTGFP